MMKQHQAHRAPLDLAGIGIGPFNLSLAAHLDAIGELEVRFFEQNESFAWHPGMMLPDVTLQTSFLKDLVSATHPVSPWSFLSYLVANRRFYAFLNADFPAIPRQEFASYLAWVAASLPRLQFGAQVREVDFDGHDFIVHLASETFRARNLALGVGLRPAIPQFLNRLRPEAAFHSSRAAFELARCAGKRVAVIGGGQSGAEIVLSLLNRGAGAPAHIDWISLRPNFLPLDETPFTNELFTPPYVVSFHSLPEARRHTAVEREKLAGDGVSAETLQAIYRRLYVLRHLETGGPSTSLLPHREVINAEPMEHGYQLIMRNGMDGQMDIRKVDILVLATGYSYELPSCLAPLASRIDLDRSGRPRLDPDFAVRWDGPAASRIFALNAGLLSHGIAEPQLSLMAWRSAVIANALARRKAFDVERPETMVQWLDRMPQGAEAGGKA